MCHISSGHLHVPQWKKKKKKKNHANIATLGTVASVPGDVGLNPDEEG
jgi:hypothetical protein